MATAPLTPDLPPPALLARIGREKLESFIEAAIALLDQADGDCDLEPDNEDGCLAGDDKGTAWNDYDDGMPGDPEDTEEDDPCGAALAA